MRNLFIVMLCLFGIACSQAPPNQLALKETLLRVNDELFHKGNLDYVDQAFSSDYNGRGPEHLKSFIEDLRTAIPDLKIEIEPIIIQDQLVGWQRKHYGTHSGELLGFAPTNKPIEWTSIILSRYEDGKIAQEWGQGNLSAVLKSQAQANYRAEDIVKAAEGVVNSLNQQNVEAYQSFLHEDFSYFLIQSADLSIDFDAKAMKEGFQNGMQFNMNLSDLQVKFYGDTAVCTGYEDGEASMVDGRVISGKRKYTSVWVNENGRWQEVHLHISKS
ncbi:MAG: DUF4440 domain-containing protein [Cyanothece sp. SIO1E1]|nr:DUF4440 domain-containing protein [Cyanothece sp. SIO1E1]